MMLLTGGLLGLLLVISAPPTSAQANIINNGIINFIEGFRVDMRCGFPQSNIPVMAPLRHANRPVSINLNEFALQATLQQFEALDLDTFRIVNVDFNMVFMRMDFHFHYAQLRSNGNFRQAVGRSPGNCAIYGNGGFAVRANNVNYFMSSRLVLRGGTLEMGEMTTRITFGSFNSNVVSFVGTQAQSAQCNTMLEQRMPAIMAAGEPQISRYFENVFRPIANSFIRGMTLQDLLNIITAPSNPVPWCRAAAPATADVAVEDVVADEPEPEHTL